MSWFVIVIEQLSLGGQIVGISVEKFVFKLKLIWKSLLVQYQLNTRLVVVLRTNRRL